MNAAFAVFIMMNNYFHDVATAMPLASGVIMWVILNRAENHDGPALKLFILRLYDGISKMVLVSLIWITVGAIPRLLAFMRFEWANASLRHQELGLTAKHMLAFVILTGGIYLWISLIGRIKKLRAAYNTTL